MAIVPAAAQTMRGYDDPGAVKERLGQLPLQDIEGLWHFAVNGTTIAIERDDPEASRFRIVAVDSPFLIFEPGELLGYATPTVKRNVFEARLKEIKADGSHRDVKLEKNQSFTLTLVESDALQFKPITRGLRVNWDWWRLFPYLFRFRVKTVDSRPDDLDGAVRLWPRSTQSPPRQPRYL